jgi:hypothetical protein
VLIGCSPPDLLDDLRQALEAAGHEVAISQEADAVLRAARSGGADLVVVADNLHGGSGADICEVLDGLSSRSKLLYVGPDAQPGADASAEPGDTFIAVELALALLERSESREREKSRSQESVDWSVDSAGQPVDEPVVPEKAPAVAKPAPAPKPAAPGNGSVRPANGSAEPKRPSPVSAERVKALLRRAREADYFEVLGIATDASDAEVRAAHAAQLAVVKELARESPANRAHLEEVRAVIEEALDVLGNPSLRAAYTRNRV